MFRPFKKRSRSGIVLVFALFGFPFSAQAANDCPAILPADAAALSQPYLCRFANGTSTVEAVCREYSSEDALFKVVFRGGTVPLAVVTRSSQGFRTTMEIPDGDGCDLERPAVVPRAAVYRGTGVCQDDSGQSLPCSVYENAAAREPEVKRYFVYYRPDGAGVRNMEMSTAGRNENALIAELTYQLGIALAQTSCCHDMARNYLAHAASLFPADAIYAVTLSEIYVRGSEAESAASDFGCGGEVGSVASRSF